MLIYLNLCVIGETPLCTCAQYVQLYSNFKSVGFLMDLTKDMQLFTPEFHSSKVFCSFPFRNHCVILAYIEYVIFTCCFVTLFKKKSHSICQKSCSIFVQPSWFQRDHFWKLRESRRIYFSQSNFLTFQFILHQYLESFNNSTILQIWCIIRSMSNYFFCLFCVFLFFSLPSLHSLWCRSYAIGNRWRTPKNI